MKRSRPISLAALISGLVFLPQMAHACGYHAMFTNLTFGKFVMALLQYFQDSATQAMMNAAIGLQDGTNLTPLFTALAFGFGYGALHALGPGHGKLIISSYFLGQDGKMKEGLIMGTQIAVVHVASAILIVWIAHFLLSNVFVSESADYRYVRLASYGAITGIGLYMMWGALKKAAHHLKHHRGAHANHHHHDHDPIKAEGSCTCAAHEKLSGQEGKKRSFISVMVGVVPCTGAILVMLFALANDMVLLGTLVVVAISIGMAATMASLGMASVWLRRSVLEKTGSGGAITINLELLGALLIISIGGVLFSLTL